MHVVVFPFPLKDTLTLANITSWLMQMVHKQCKHNNFDVNLNMEQNLEKTMWLIMKSLSKKNSKTKWIIQKRIRGMYIFFPRKCKTGENAAECCDLRRKVRNTVQVNFPQCLSFWVEIPNKICEYWSVYVPRHRYARRPHSHSHACYITVSQTILPCRFATFIHIRCAVAPFTLTLAVSSHAQTYMAHIQDLCKAEQLKFTNETKCKETCNGLYKVFQKLFKESDIT